MEKLKSYDDDLKPKLYSIMIRLMLIIAVVLYGSMAQAQTQSKSEKHYPHYDANNELGKVKIDIAKILDKEVKSISDHTNGTFASAKDFQVFDDRIECKIKNQKTIINYSDLINIPIALEEHQQTGEDGKFYTIYYSLNLKHQTIYLRINYVRAMQLTNDLFFIQHQLMEKRSALQLEEFASQLNIFEPIASQYRALKVKPAVPEAQREFIVQANSFNEKKNYNKAIEYYNKAIEADQTAYPAAYSNLALLSAQTGKFDAAIYYMKKYLLLEPEATDARSAQDKIYEWKIATGK